MFQKKLYSTCVPSVYFEGTGAQTLLITLHSYILRPRVCHTVPALVPALFASRNITPANWNEQNMIICHRWKAFITQDVSGCEGNTRARSSAQV